MHNQQNFVKVFYFLTSAYLVKSDDFILILLCQVLYHMKLAGSLEHAITRRKLPNLNLPELKGTCQRLQYCNNKQEELAIGGENLPSYENYQKRHFWPSRQNAHILRQRVYLVSDWTKNDKGCITVQCCLA